jgi:hypothetical protein
VMSCCSCRDTRLGVSESSMLRNTCRDGATCVICVRCIRISACLFDVQSLSLFL